LAAAKEGERRGEAGWPVSRLHNEANHLTFSLSTQIPNISLRIPGLNTIEANRFF